MKKFAVYYSTLLSILLLNTCTQKEIHHNWEDPSIFAVNQVKPHCPLVSFEDKETALQCRPGLSKYYKSLNGVWKFKWVSKVEDASENFFKPYYDVSKWDDIEIPSVWQSKGYGNTKDNTEEVLQSPPNIMGNNPVGSYRTTFTIPEHWNGRQILLHFEGVQSAFSLWVNGMETGYNESGGVPVQFDITPFIQPGDNILAVRVYQWCDGNYIENPESGLLSGIIGNVYLLAKPVLSITDMNIHADLDDNYYNADIKLKIRLKNNSQEIQKQRKITVSLYNKNNAIVFSKDIAINKPIKPHEEKEVTFLQVIENPAKWSAEHPNLYTLILSHFKSDSILEEIVSQRIGIREIDIQEGQLLVNGTSIEIKGVNMKEFHPITGKIISREEMKKDIILLKQNNINAVRTVKGPHATSWYDLCDEYGIYVWDETIIGSHDLKGSLSNNHGWQEAYLHRGQALIQRDKNHPSVIVWSLGQDAGKGDNINTLANTIQHIDPSRPIYYENILSYNTTDVYTSTFDILSDEYMPKQYLISFHDSFPEKPVILNTYINTQGNNCGRLKEYKNIIDQYPQMQGGFISNWAMEGWQRISEDSTIYYEPPFSKVYSFSGLVYPDRKETPALNEVKKVYQNIEISPLGLYSGRILLTNKYNFTNLKYFDATWEIVRDGRRVFGGKVWDIDIPPKQKKIIDIPYSRFTTAPGKEYFLTISFTLPEDTKWAQEGHEVAWAQFKLPFYSPRPQALNLNYIREIECNESDANITITNNDFMIVFSKQKGEIISYTYKESELIKKGPKWNAWRPSCNNYSPVYENWLLLHPDSLHTIVKNYKIQQLNSKMIRVYFMLEYADRYDNKVFDVQHAYTAYGNGAITITTQVIPQDTLEILLPKAGLQLELPEEFNTLTWFGKGPYETYPDRNEALVSVYESPVEDLFEHYLVPQENGNRSDVRWAAITAENGDGIFISGNELLNVSAYYYKDAEIENAKYNVELTPGNFITLNIDFLQSGLDIPFDAMENKSPYMIYAQNMNFTVFIRPFNSKKVSPVLMHNSRLPVVSVDFPDYTYNEAIDSN